MSSKRGVRHLQIGVMPAPSFVERDGQLVGGHRDGQTAGRQSDGQTVKGSRDGQTEEGQRAGQTVGRQRAGQTVTLRTPGYDIGEEGHLAQVRGEKLMDRGHPILVRTSPSERDLSVKLKKYFGSRSKSGGGECDVTRVDGQTYCTIFQNQDDQRRVLGRRDHIIEFTMPVKVQDIGSKDLARIRPLSQNEERLKMQQLTIRISPSDDMKTEIPVDTRHMDILRKLKHRQISDIEKKYNVKMEERRKTGSSLVTFRTMNASLDLSPHASHSFITLLQKTFFNIERKEIRVEPKFKEERVGTLQKQLMMSGINIVMQYSKGTVLLIGHPVHVAFAVEKLNGSQNPGRGQTRATSGDPLDTSSSSAAAQKEDEPDTCPICLSEIEDKVILEKCKHAYCKDCLKQAMAHKPVCPICGVSYGTVRGNQPDGTMSETRHRNSLPGYPGCGTIEIYYNIPGGIQKENHPRPGRSFSGTRRRAYLPDNKEGRDILRLLERAFDQRLIFTVGDSRTTGATDTVTWNDVHHKTNTHGGPQSFGYPDPDYLTRVRDELRAKGIE